MPDAAGAQIDPADWPDWHIWRMARGTHAKGGWCASRIAAVGRESNYLTEAELDKGLSMTLVADDTDDLLCQLMRQAEIASSLANT